MKKIHLKQIIPIVICLVLLGSSFFVGLISFDPSINKTVRFLEAYSNITLPNCKNLSTKTTEGLSYVDLTVSKKRGEQFIALLEKKGRLLDMHNLVLCHCKSVPNDFFITIKDKENIKTKYKNAKYFFIEDNYLDWDDFFTIGICQKAESQDYYVFVRSMQKTEREIVKKAKTFYWF